MKPATTLFLLALCILVACGPSLEEQSRARMTDAVTAALVQSNAQQNQMLLDLQTRQAQDNAQIHALRAQNVELVNQLAAQQQSIVPALLDTIHAQNALITVLAALVLLGAVALLALMVYLVFFRRTTIPSQRVYSLPISRYPELATPQTNVVTSDDRALIPSRRR